MMKILFIIALAILVFIVSLFLFCALNIIPQEMEDRIETSDYDGTPDKENDSDEE